MWHEMTDDQTTADGDQRFLCNPVVAIGTDDILTITCGNARYDLTVNDRGLLMMIVKHHPTVDPVYVDGRRAVNDLKSDLLWEHIPTFWRNQIKRNARTLTRR
jgi:hypothetical protein